jgi:hypothetical protein
MAKFEVLSRHFPEGTEDNHGNVSQGSRSAVLNWNLGPSEYEARVLAIRQPRSVLSNYELSFLRRSSN